jgi:hypothetical protein
MKNMRLSMSEIRRTPDRGKVFFRSMIFSLTALGNVPFFWLDRALGLRPSSPIFR